MRQLRVRNGRQPVVRNEAPEQDAVVMRARAYTLMPSPLIPFGSFVPRQRRGVQPPKDRR